MINRLLRKLRPRATLVKYNDPMKVEDIQRIFREQGEDSRIWQALDTLIDNHLLDAVNEVSDPKISPNQLSHASGRIDAISNLKSRIEQFKK